VEFKKAADEVWNLKTTPSNDELLTLYSWYKQATIGDINTEEPFWFNFKAKNKWKAWKSREGTDKKTAKKMYVSFVEEMKKKYGLNENQ
jgi:diazepam-binding inhibitor (GABA receptor modulating acyl-CoA-binding protein)